MRSITNILFGFFLLFSWGVLAQGSKINLERVFPSSNHLEGKLSGTIFYMSALANGNFLYPSEWADGRVELSDGEVIDSLRLRYHADEDELIAFNKNLSSLFYVEKGQVKSFFIRINGQDHKFVNIEKNKSSEDSRYFEELYAGTNALLKRHYVYTQKVGPYKDERGIMRDEEYHLRFEYYFYSKKEGYEKASVKRRAFLTAYPEKKKEIKKILRAENIRPTDEKSMVKAFEVLDQHGIFN